MRVVATLCVLLGVSLIPAHAELSEVEFRRVVTKFQQQAKGVTEVITQSLLSL